MKQHVWNAIWDRLEQLPGGAQGFTWLAKSKSPSNSKRYILKELRHQRDKQRRLRMNAEVASLQRLDHAGVARLVDSNASQWAEDEELFLVMEFVPGPHLRQHVDEHGLPSLQAALDSTLRLLDIVEYCHGQDVIHRDIKPENIVIRDGVLPDIVLLDFGLSFNVGIDADENATKFSESFGSKFLRVPEFESGSEHKRDGLSDITACVGILFYMITGEYPRTLSDAQGLMPHQRPSALQKIQQIPRHKADGIQRIFEVGFQHVRSFRWQSIGSLREAIRSVAEQQVDGGATVLSFDERVKQRRVALDHSNEHRFRVQAAGVMQYAQDVFLQATNVIQNRFLDVFSVGLEQNSLDKRKWALRARVIIDHLAYELRMFVEVLAAINDSEFILKIGSNHTAAEVLRIPVSDPHAKRLIRECIEEAFDRAISAAI